MSFRDVEKDDSDYEANNQQVCQLIASQRLAAEMNAQGSCVSLAISQIVSYLPPSASPANLGRVISA